MASRTRKKSPHERLKEFISARKPHGLTQEKAAEALGVTGASLSDWLSEKATPRGIMRKAIELWTDGEIVESEWMSEEEREALERITPATGTEG